MNSDNQENIYYHQDDEFCDLSDKFSDKLILIIFFIEYLDFFDIDRKYTTMIISIR